MSSLDTWWTGLRTAALVGTTRRPPPPLPELGVAARTDARAEEALLDAAALGAALRRSGVHAASGREPAETAPDETQPEAPPSAVPLLELLLEQLAAGGRQRRLLVGHWCEKAATTGRRVPHRLLPQLLELATAERDLQAAAAEAAGERGRWLGRLNPDWTWVAEGAPAVATESWPILATDARLALLIRLRADDPATARQLVQSTWSTDSAKDRKAQLDTLWIGLGPDDEDLLEQALDDRAPSVRELAATLLDGLPGSARGQRMAERLRPLIRAAGVLKREIEVALPDEPDEAGVRDGLRKPPRGRSKRGWWLERIVTGAPLEVWTEVTRASPTTIVTRIQDDDARHGLRRAVQNRSDSEWARALLGRSWDPGLLPLLPQDERERIALARLGALKARHQIGEVLAAVPAPWGSKLSVAVVRRLADDDDADLTFRYLFSELAAGLHPDALALLDQWRERTDGLPSSAASLLKFRSVKRSITEAFS